MRISRITFSEQCEIWYSRSDFFLSEGVAINTSFDADAYVGCKCPLLLFDLNQILSTSPISLSMKSIDGLFSAAAVDLIRTGAPSSYDRRCKEMRMHVEKSGKVIFKAMLLLYCHPHFRRIVCDTTILFWRLGLEGRLFRWLRPAQDIFAPRAGWEFGDPHTNVLSA
jgi:hypothetical protein